MLLRGGLRPENVFKNRAKFILVANDFPQSGKWGLIGRSRDEKMKIASFALSRPEAPSKRAGVNNTFYVTVTVSNSGDKTGVASVSLVVDGKNVGTQRVNVKGRSTSKTTFAAATNVKKERYAKVRATLSDGKSSQEVTIPIIPFY